MNTHNPNPHASWPLSASNDSTGEDYKKVAPVEPPVKDPHANPHCDPVEQELVDEQLARDRKATKAIDGKMQDKDHT